MGLIDASDLGFGSSDLETLAKGGITSLTQMLGDDTIMPSQTPQEFAEANVAEATKGLTDFPQNVVDGVTNPPAADSRKLLQLDGLTNELGQLLQAGLNTACNGIQQRFTVLQHLLETEEMPVNALAIASVGDVLDMRIQR